MPKIRFSGRVFPSAIKISVKDHPKINWKDSENELDMTFAITIQDSAVNVDCDLNKFVQEDHLTAVFMRAFDLARATVDLVAFSSGYGVTVIIDTFTNPNGQTTPFVLYDPSLVPLCTAYTMGIEPTELAKNDFNTVLQIVALDWRIFRILRTLIEAITVPHESATDCARAIEGLRNIIAVNGGSRGQAWGAMRNTLNISEAYLKSITEVSIGPRHGDHAHIPGTKTTEITRRSWVIMNRFFEYKKRNAGPLPIAEFPLLAG